MLRFAFRCPRVWDAPPVDGQRYCTQCDKWVTDLTVLPGLDVQQWVREHPDACARVFADRKTGQPLARTPAAASVLAVVAARACGDTPAEPAPVEVVAPLPETHADLSLPAPDPVPDAPEPSAEVPRHRPKKPPAPKASPLVEEEPEPIVLDGLMLDEG